MCGICGFVGEGSEEVVRGMSDTLTHRGPDESGCYWQEGIGLGHRRLTIVDLVKGQQPMFNRQRSLVITYNGEIYNHQALREELVARGCRFTTDCDTETLLYAYAEWGEDCLTKLNGMFAFAVADLNARTVFMARDRFGQKPLHYYHKDGLFVFASELKAMTRHPAVKKELNLAALQKYLFFEYVPEPETILENVAKLPAGHWLKFADGTVTIKPYWDSRFDGEPVVPVTEAEARAGVVQHLRQAVKYRLMSDVPLGVFLSGGIDSSSLVAMLAEQQPACGIKTFSINFTEKSFDESSYSRKVAAHFQTQHHEETLAPQVMIDIIPEIFAKLDEPFADASIIPTYLLSKFTRQHVTVALGGDGADELFAGYDPFLAHYYLGKFKLPGAISRGLSRLAETLIPVSGRNMSRDFIIKKTLTGLAYEPELRNQIWLGAFSADAQEGLLRHPETLDVERLLRPLTCLKTGAMTLYHKIIYHYIKLYLQGDILTKIDRASMMNSLEVRSPFLDHQFAEYVNRLPAGYKLRRGRTKFLLKEAMREKLPPGITERRKKGFGIPLTNWFKQELRELLLDTLDPVKLGQEGIFAKDYVQQLIDQHMRSKKDNRKELWTLLVFQLWKANYLDQVS